MADPKTPGSGPDPKAAKELADNIAAVKTAATEATKAFEGQLRIISQMKDAMSQIAETMTTLADPSKGSLSSETLDKVEKSLSSVGKEGTTTTKVISGLSKVMQSDMTKSAVVAAGALTGLRQGFKNFFALARAGFGVVTGLVDTLFSIGSAIVAIPFNLMGKLFNMAASHPGTGELRQAYEDLREEFGNFQQTTSKAVIDVAHNLKGLEGKGVSAYKIFGNLAERMKMVTQLAKEMGAEFNLNSKEIVENGDAIIKFQKGLGLTGEQMGAISRQSRMMGTTMSKQLIDMTKQTYGMAKAFGVDAKVISKDMGRALQDLAHFGHLSQKELAVAATYANKLGVSIDKLTGVMDQTQTFDQAAESTARLNEQFGLNLDATKLMMAQTGAEKVEMYRQAFMRTGKDLSKLDYQTKNFIKAQTGMTDEVFAGMVAMKDQGNVFDKISKQGEKNEKKTMDQAEAMHELADAIKRNVKVGELAQGGIFGNLLDGFFKGIQRSREFRDMMRNITRVLQQVQIFGRKLGNMFVEMFPGIKDILGGIKDLFDPKKFSSMFGEILDAFKVFQVGGPEAVGKFMDKLKAIFDKFLGKESAAGGKLLEGFQKFKDAALLLLKEAFKWLVDKLGPPLKQFMSDMWDKLVEAIEGMSTKTKLIIGGAIASLILIPAIVQAFTAAAASAALKSGGSMLMSAIGAVTSKLPGAAAGKSAESASAAVGQAQQVADKSKELDKSAGGIQGPGLVSKLLMLAGVIAIGLGAMWVAMKMFADVPVKTILKAGLGLTVAMGVMAEAGLATLGLAFIGKLPFGQIMKGLAAVGLVLLAMIGAMKLTFWAFSDSKMDANKMKGVMESLYIMGDVFIQGAKIGLASLVVGAALIGPQGIIALAGLAAIGAVVKKLAGITKDVMATLSELKEEPSVIKTKAEAFASIVNSLSNMVGQVASILKAMDFGLESQKSKIGKIRAVSDLIRVLIDGEDGNGGINAVIKNIIDGLKELTPDKVKVAEAFASVLGAIGGVMGSSSKAAADIVSRSTWWFQSAEDDREMVKLAMDNARNFITGVLESFKSLLDKIKGVLSDTAKIEGVEKAGPVVGSMLQAVASLASTLTVNIDSVDKITGLKDNPELIIRAINMVTSFASNLLFELKTSLPPLIKNLTGGVLDVLSGFTPDQLKLLPTVIEVLKGVASFVTGLSGFFKSSDLKDVKIGDVTGNVNIVTQSVPNVAKVLNDLAQGVPELVDGMITVAKTLPGGKEGKVLKDNLSTVTAIFDAIGKVTAAISQASSGMPKEPNTSSDLQKGLLYVSTALQILTGEIWIGDKANASGIFGLISKLATDTSQYSMKELSTALKAVQDMVAAVQQMDDSLSKIDKINLSASLTKVAGAVGLGSKGVYTVKSKEVVVNINLEVKMSAGEVEEVIVMRKNSIIRDRLNFALANNTNNTIPESIKTNDVRGARLPAAGSVP